MTSRPERWTTDKLAGDAATAAAMFRASRLVATDSWNAHYHLARGKFELLFKQLSDLDPAAITDDNLAAAYGLGLGEALRYLAGPPISDDDLRVLADVESIASGVLQKHPEALRKVFEVIERVIDPHRFPWIEAGVAPARINGKPHSSPPRYFWPHSASPPNGATRARRIRSPP